MAMIILKKPVRVNDIEYTVMETPGDLMLFSGISRDGLSLRINEDSPFALPLTGDGMNLGIITDIAAQVSKKYRDILLDKFSCLLDFTNSQNWEIADDAQTAMDDWAKAHGLVEFTRAAIPEGADDLERYVALMADGHVLSIDKFAERIGMDRTALASKVLDLTVASIDNAGIEALKVFMEGEDRYDSLCAKYARLSEPAEEKPVNVNLPASKEREVAGEILAATGEEVQFPAGLKDNALNNVNTADGTTFTILMNDGKVYVPHSMLAIGQDVQHSREDYRKCTKSTAARMIWNDTSNGDEVSVSKELRIEKRRPLEMHDAAEYTFSSARRLEEFRERMRRERIEAFRSRINEGYSKALTVAKSNYQAARNAVAARAKALADNIRRNRERRRFIKTSVKDINERLFSQSGIEKRDIKGMTMTSTACIAHTSTEGTMQTVSVIDHASNETVGTFSYDRSTGRITNLDGSFIECNSLEDCIDTLEAVVLHPSNIEALRTSKIDSLIENAKSENPTLLNGWQRLERYEDKKGREYFMVYKPTDKNIPEGAYVADDLELLKNRLGGDVQIVHGEENIAEFKENLKKLRDEEYIKHLGAPMVVDAMEHSTYLVRQYSKHPWASQKSLALRPLEAFIGTYAAMNVYESIKDQLSDILNKENIIRAAGDNLRAPDGGKVSEERLAEEVDGLLAFHEKNNDWLDINLGGNGLYVQDPMSEASLTVQKTADGELIFKDADDKKYRIVSDNGDNEPDTKLLKDVIKEFKAFSSPKMKELQMEVQNVLISRDEATGIEHENITEEHTEGSGIKVEF